MMRYLLVVVVVLLSLSMSSTAADRTWAVDSFFDVFTELSATGGGPLPVNATGTVVTREGAPGADGGFDTEMLALNLTGLSPLGPVMIRESPTRASLGRVSIPIVGDPDFDLLRVHSFFDVFTELSLDGGQTWLSNDQPAHFAGGADSFFDITYRLDGDVALIGDGHVTVLKSGTWIDPSVPEPGGLIALLTGLTGLVGVASRRTPKRKQEVP